MHRQCDDCKGVFKIPSKLEPYIIKNPSKKLYCPYCGGVCSHIYNREYEHEKLASRRGKIFEL